MLAYETPEDAFTAGAIQWQLELMSGFPINATIVRRPSAGDPAMRPWLD